MANFFDERSAGYDEHMQRSVASFDSFYEAIAQAIPQTEEELHILDLGCGTGLELRPIFDRAPNACITGIDLSARMLQQLRRKYSGRLRQIMLIQGSYLELAFGKAAYDYGVSVMTLHHLLPMEKKRLYRRVRRALKPGGAYIEGDYIAAAGDEEQMHDQYKEKLKAIGATNGGFYHIDVPLTLRMQHEILLQAGFSAVEVLWAEEESAVYVAAA